MLFDDGESKYQIVIANKKSQIGINVSSIPRMKS